MSKNRVTKTIGFTTFPTIVLLDTLILQHFQKQYCLNHGFNNISKHNVAETIGFTTFPKLMLLKAIVLQQFQT